MGGVVGVGKGGFVAKVEGDKVPATAVALPSGFV